jgi:hypothetical protein
LCIRALPVHHFLSDRGGILAVANPVSLLFSLVKDATTHIARMLSGG